MPKGSVCVFFALLLGAVMSDLKRSKIPNGLILTGFFFAVLTAFLEQGLAGSKEAVFGMAFAAVLAVPLFALGAWGAGDAKLFMAAGGFLGAKDMMVYLGWCMGCGAILALMKMIRKGNLRERMGVFAAWLIRCAAEGRPVSYGQSFQEKNALIHMSVPMLLAALILYGRR